LPLMVTGCGSLKCWLLVNQNRGEGLGGDQVFFGAAQVVCPVGVGARPQHGAYARDVVRGLAVQFVLDNEAPLGAEFQFEFGGVLGAAVGFVEDLQVLFAFGPGGKA
jgi:hypothetical protein